MTSNSVLTTNMEYSAVLPLWQAYYKMLQELLVRGGESPDRYSCLAPLCQQHLGLETEHRKHEWVKFYVQALCCGIENLPDVCSCELLVVDQITAP